jgi:hypothetical protein
MSQAVLRQMGAAARPETIVRYVGAVPTNGIPYQQIPPPVQLQPGLRYRIGFQQTFGYDPGNPISYRADVEMRAQFDAYFTIESLEPQQPAQYVPGLDVYEQPWILQGVAKGAGILGSTPQMNLLVAGVQATGAPGMPTTVPPGSPSTTNWSSLKIVGWGVGLAVLTGAVWGGYRVYRH